MAKKEKIYSYSLVTDEIILGSSKGPVKIYIDDNNQLKVDLRDSSGTEKSIRLDPDSKKIIVDEIDFADGSSFSLINGKVPEDKIPEIQESKLSSGIRTKLNSSAAAVDSYFDENGKLKDSNAPTDYDTVRDNASNGNTISGYFDENGILDVAKIPDRVPLKDINTGRIANNILPTNLITETNFEDTLVFDTRFAGKNPITTANFGSNFDTAFTGKNPITTANFETELDFDTRFAGKNPVTTGAGGNFDNLFDGKVPTGYASWSALATNATNGNTALGKFSGAGGKLPIDSVIPPGSYTGWGDINTDLAKGISADSDLNSLDFSIDNTDPNNPIVKIDRGGSRGDATTTIGKSSIGLSNVANESPSTIREGIGLSVNSTTGQISITRSGTTTLTGNPLSSTEFTTAKTNATNALTNASTAQSTADSANTTATTVRNFFGNETTPQLKDGNTPSNLKNSNLSLSLNGTSLSLTNGGGSSLTLGKANVGLNQVDNVSANAIRNGISVTNGVLTGIGTANIVVDNSSIGLSRDETSGEITLNKGVGTPVTVNPFTATRFTEVSGVANSALSNAAVAQSTANTIESRFTLGKLNEVNAADALKNSNVTKTSIGLDRVENESPATIREGITVDDNGQLQGIGAGAGTVINNSKITVNPTTGILQGIGTSNIAVKNDLITKTSIGLPNVENKSSSDIRGEISVTNGVLTGIGTANIVVDNSTIGLSRDATSGEITLNKGVGTPVTVNPFTTTRFTEVSGVANSALTNASTAQSTADSANTTATTVRKFFGTETTPQLKDGNTPSNLKNSNISLSLSGQTFTFNNGTSTNISIDKTNVGLDQVANESPATIRSSITIDGNGILQGIGSTGIAVKNSLITKSTLGLGSVENYSLAQIKDSTLAESRFTDIENRFTAGVLKTANLPSVGLNNLDTSVTQSLAKADTLNGYFSSGRLKDSNAPSDYSSVRSNATNGNSAFSYFSSGQLASSRLPADSDSFKFDSTNKKLIIGDSNAQTTYNGNQNQTYSDYTDVEIIGPDTSEPDMALMRTGTDSNYIGSIWFKGYDGTTTNQTVYGGTYNPVGGWSLPGTVAVPDFTTRAGIRAYAWNTGGSRLSFYTSNDTAGSSADTRMVIIPNGNVGIGTTSPAAVLDIVRNNATDAPQGALRIQGTTWNSHFSYATDEHTYIRGGKAGSQVLINDASGLGNVLLCKGGGKVAIGNLTSPASALHIKQYSGNGSNGPGLRLEEASTSTNYWSIYSNNYLYFNKNAVNEARISADGTTNETITFTGQHRNKSDNVSLYTDSSIGLIVASVGEFSNLDGFNGVTINESLPKVELASQRKQKSVFGVISNAEDKNDGRLHSSGKLISIYRILANDERLIINSLGEGGIWVSNINGNLENGDYITTCEIPGYGMKQDDDLLHNYTVAKITCDCNFDLESPIYICEEFQWEGQTYRRAFVGCTYHCG